MKTIKNHGMLLGIGLLGATSLVGISTPASAAPRRDVQEARKDVKEAKKEVREERRDLRQADTPRERFEASRELRDAKGDLVRENRDLRYEQGGVRRPAVNSKYIHTGTVTGVHSNQSFDVNIGGNTFNVYTNSRVPLGLTKGDLVRINGVQMYTNDIREASVSIVRNL